MEYPAFEFEVEVGPDGAIQLPKHIREKIGGSSSITIRLTEGIVPKHLRRKNVTEEEVEEISGVQMEQRENVIRFLQAEGALGKRRAFKALALKLLGTR